jgi:hypothetical protein
MENWFHRRGGWSEDVVAFSYIFNSGVSPVELKIFQKTQSRKNPPEKTVASRGFDEGDRQWRWTESIQGEFLHPAESWPRAGHPPTTVHPSIR